MIHVSTSRAPKVALTRRVFCTGTLASAVAPSRPREARAAPLFDFVGAANGFGHNLFLGCLGDHCANVVLSPLSLGLCAAMAGAGAAGQTATEFEAAFRLRPGAASDLAGAAQPLVARLARLPGLALANGLALRDEATALAPDYVARVRASFAADVMPGASVRTVDAWLSAKTDGKITHLVDDTGDLALLNALYFRADWERPAARGETRDSPFVTAAGEAMTVPGMMMHRVQCLERSDFQTFLLPYAASRAAMLISLPTRGQVATAAARALGPGLVRDLIASGTGEGDDDLVLPRFTLSFGREMKSVFEALGLKAMFDPDRADFSGMAGKPGNLHIGQVAHRAVVAVDEAGTVASAATAITMMPPGEIRRPATVHVVDRPFLLHIVDRDSGSVLVQGCVNDPRPGATSLNP